MVIGVATSLRRDAIRIPTPFRYGRICVCTYRNGHHIIRPQTRAEGQGPFLYLCFGRANAAGSVLCMRRNIWESLSNETAMIFREEE